MNEHTTFEEKMIENEAQIPSFTLCPSHPDGPIKNKSIESFEDVEKAIENVNYRYTVLYSESKQYEKLKRVVNKYNDTPSGNWKFAPKISSYYPFEAVICLIWTPPREHKIKHDWTIMVSSSKDSCIYRG